MSSDYGVKYSPATAVKVTPLSNTSIQELRNGYGIKYIRLQWVDFTNNILYRVISIEYFDELLKTPRPSVSITKCVLGLVFITLAPGFSAIGEYLYVPDMNTLRLCPYAPGHASVMGYFEEKEPIGPNSTFTVPICPRTTLKRVVEWVWFPLNMYKMLTSTYRDANTAGVEFLVGFETEFILLKSTSPIQAVNTHSWSSSKKLPSGSVETKVLDEIANALQKSGITLQMYHAEAAPGQVSSLMISWVLV